MQSKATTVEAYLASLPPDRREAISAVRAAILKNIPAGFEETMQYGMISYVVPLSRFPKTYNGHALSIISLGTQKNYMVVHLMALYGNKPTLNWFVAAYKKTGKKLDMGMACVRFKTLDDLPVDLIGETAGKCSAENLIAAHEKAHSPAAVTARRAAKKLG
jgi:Domain of unknown function (DU1801)